MDPEARTPPSPTSPRSTSLASLSFLTVLSLKLLSMLLYHALGPVLNRSLPSHLAAEGPSLLGVDHVLRVPVPPPGKGGRNRGGDRDELGDDSLFMTLLVKKALPPAGEGGEWQGEGGGGSKGGVVREEKGKGNLPPLLFLLHGFPDDASTFHAQVLPFARAGFDVLLPVMPGYEPSTALLPSSSYSLPSLATMLEDVIAWAQSPALARALRGGEAEGGKGEEGQQGGWLEEGGIGEEECRNPLPRDVHLFGHDWGAVLAYILARKGSREKVRVTSVVTVAVPHEAARGFLTHPRQFLNSWYMLFIVSGPKEGGREYRAGGGGCTRCCFFSGAGRRKRPRFAGTFGG